MVEDDVLGLVESTLRDHALAWIDGFEIVEPEPLTVLRTAARPVRLHWIPYFGRALSVVLIARHPVDIDLRREGGDAELLRRLVLAVEHRYPVRKAPALVLSAVVVTPTPIEPEDEARMEAGMASRRGGGRTVPLGLFRINPGQEAVSFALRRGPAGLFPEVDALADAVCLKLQRFVPPIVS